MGSIQSLKVARYRQLQAVVKVPVRGHVQLTTFHGS